MSHVFVVDTYQRPLDPVHPGRARLLLSQGKAAVWRRFPFTIILRKEVEHPQVQPLRLKLDPGSKTTGIALVNEVSGEVVFAAELTHRGQQIKKDLEKGFQTGDIVRAIVTTGKKQGRYVGRVLVRATGSFDLATKQGRVAGLAVRFFTAIHRADGYSYGNRGVHSSPA